MPKQFNNENSGVVFINSKKQGNPPGSEKLPDRTGFCEVGGIEYWVSGWITDIKNGTHAGEKALRLKFEAKDIRDDKPANKAPAEGTPSDDEPF